MNVSELIEQLKAMPQDAPVVVGGNETTTAGGVRVTPNINKILRLPDFKGSTMYGAQMGRHSGLGENGPLYLQRVRFVDGDYDVGGAYWGSPADLYCAFAPDLIENKKATWIFVRAKDRAEAKEKVIAYIEERTGEYEGWSFYK